MKVYDFDKNMEANSSVCPELKYYDAKCGLFGIYGTKAAGEEGFCRFTTAQRDFLRPVSDGEAWFSEHSSGIQLKFITDATDIFVKVNLSGKFDMTNMTLIGSCGVDLYVYDEASSSFVFHGVMHGKLEDQEYEGRLGDFRKLGRKERRFIINLPLYMGVKSLTVGVNEWATIKPDTFQNKRNIAVYGSSITHGCSATHPGMAYTNLLSRRYDCEFLNYGFSGVCMMEPEVAQILSEINPDMLIVDAEPNAGVSKNLKLNCENFLNKFFETNPLTPVILLSRMKFALDIYDIERVKLNAYYVDFLKKVAKKYRKKGYKVYFFDQSNVFGKNFSEYTADGVHPSDLGMIKIADFYEKVINKTDDLLNRYSIDLLRKD